MDRAGESGLVRASKDIISGTMGGVAICIVGHPFDTMKVGKIKQIILIKKIK